jgi:hypothetical protein
VILLPAYAAESILRGAAIQLTNADFDKARGPAGAGKKK